MFDGFVDVLDGYVEMVCDVVGVCEVVIEVDDIMCFVLDQLVWVMVLYQCLCVYVQVLSVG